jgi:hypothetical protein
MNMPIQKVENDYQRQRQIARYFEAVKEFDECIHDIRQLPEYRRFLLKPTSKELKI